MSRPDQQKVMHEYLDALLFEDAPLVEAQVETKVETKAETERLERLLAQASVLKQEAQPRAETSTKASADAHAAESAKLEAEFARAAQLEREQEQTKLAAEVKQVIHDAPPPVLNSMQDYQQNEFQALFFSVAGLRLAVPLKTLGGIHQWQDPSTIFGKPDWYLGIMSNRDEKLNVVDTARWVMPEKYDAAMAAALDYKYLIMLGESRWGLACESLVTTETLAPGDVQWRQTIAGKRPWLAGVVREKMCAILDVQAMIAMLEQGLGSQD